SASEPRAAATGDEARLTAIEDTAILLRDRVRVQMLVRRIRQRLDRGRPVSRDLDRAARLSERSSKQLRARQALIPTAIEFPPELPVSARREEIARRIRAHQVVIVCGETGSGKTTQLAKLC